MQNNLMYLTKTKAVCTKHYICTILKETENKILNQYIFEVDVNINVTVLHYHQICI